MAGRRKKAERRARAVTSIVIELRMGSPAAGLAPVGLAPVGLAPVGPPGSDPGGRLQGWIDGAMSGAGDAGGETAVSPSAAKQARSAREPPRRPAVERSSDEGSWPGPSGGSPSLEWPIGPHYLRWVEGKGADAWARYKLRAADWYLEALRTIERDVGHLDRYVGVEMAIDGVLASLCAGIDVAGFALLEEVERLVDPGPTARSTAPDRWLGAIGLARGAGVELDSAGPLGKALGVVGGEEPNGWLTQLRELHMVSLRRNLLVRRPSVDGRTGSRVLDVPGLGQRPVVRYLAKAGRRSANLVEAILCDVDRLGGERLRSDQLLSPPHGRSLPDLAARADLIHPSWLDLDAQ